MKSKKLMICFIAAYASVAAISSASAKSEINVQSQNTVAIDKVNSIYDKTCAYCHSTEGGAPAIKSRNLTSSYVTATVRLGPNGMPAFRQSEISDSELAALSNMVSISR